MRARGSSPFAGEEIEGGSEGFSPGGESRAWGFGDCTAGNSLPRGSYCVRSPAGGGGVWREARLASAGPGLDLTPGRRAGTPSDPTSVPLTRPQPLPCSNHSFQRGVIRHLLCAQGLGNGQTVHASGLSVPSGKWGQGEKQVGVRTPCDNQHGAPLGLCGLRPGLKSCPSPFLDDFGLQFTLCLSFHIWKMGW